MGNKMVAVAVDDEFRALEVIERYASKVQFLELVKTFKSPLDAISYLERAQVDLVFLDINMPDLSGISLAKLINSKIQVIFTTAYHEYAVMGFELEATDYLLKPIEFDRFLKACLKARKQFDQLSNPMNLAQSDMDAKIILKTHGKILQINRDDFLLAEKLGNDLFIHLKSGDTLKSRLSIRELLAQLPDRFCQVHKSFVVALDNIEHFEKNQLTLAQHKIPVGRMFKQRLLEALR